MRKQLTKKQQKRIKREGDYADRVAKLKMTMVDCFICGNGTNRLRCHRCEGWGRTPR